MAEYRTVDATATVSTNSFTATTQLSTEVHQGASAVTSVNGMTGAVVLDADDVGALPNSTEIPTKTSDLDNDSGFITSAPVASVNGQTGTVVLDAEDVGALPDDTAIPTKTSDLDNDSGFITEAVTTVTVSGTDPVITAEDNHRYICGEVLTLNFTPCESGICDVLFTSGTTPTVLTLPQTVKFPDTLTIEASKTYEINIVDGVYGVVVAWA